MGEKGARELLQATGYLAWGWGQKIKDMLCG